MIQPRSAAEGVAADDAQLLRRGVAPERREGVHRGARECLDIGALKRHRTGHGHLAAQVELALGEELADGCDASQGHRPDDVFLPDRRDVADLHADVAGGVLALEGVQLTVLQGCERGRLVAVETHADLARSQLGQGADTGLDVCQGVAEAVVAVCGEGGGVESGYEDVARGCGGVGDDAVGALDQPRPEAALEEGLADLPGVQFGGVLDAEIDGFPLAVRLDEDGEQFALVSSDDLLDRTAHRRAKEDVSVLFVCHDGGAAEHGVAFLDQKSGEKTLEVSRLDRNDARRYRL